jgi:hypothetical protein
MAVLELENQEIRRGPVRVRVPRARLEVSWPAGCTRFDVRRADITARVRAELDVPANACLVQAGSLWRLHLAHGGRRMALDVLAESLGDITPGPCRGRRLYAWAFLVVGVPAADPLGLFPGPAFLRDPAGADRTEEVPVDLGELAAWIAGEVGSLEPARFDAEGGFTPAGG